MFDFATQAETIVSALDAIPEIGTVAYVDEDRQSARYPVAMPAAFVAMEKLAAASPRNRSSAAEIVWAVIVRGKRLNGTDGIMPIVDLVVDTLVGLQTIDGAIPLKLIEVVYYDQQAESVAYAVRFGGKIKEIRSCK